MTNETMKIKYTEIEDRVSWTTLEDVNTVYSEKEIVTMVQRYLDTQAHAITYRKKAQVKAKVMKSRLAELEAKIAAGNLVEVPEEEEEGE